MIGIALVVGWVATKAFPADRVPGTASVVRVTMEAGGFDPTEIRVRRGEPVTIRFRNPADPASVHGIGEHQFAIDELGVNLVVTSGDSASVTLTPDTAGRYVFYCDVCCGGRANPSMTGTLVVEEA